MNEQVQCGCKSGIRGKNCFDYHVSGSKPAAHPATDKEKVLKVYPEAYELCGPPCAESMDFGYCRIFESFRQQRLLGEGPSSTEAWADAASRLPSADGEEKKCDCCKYEQQVCDICQGVSLQHRIAPVPASAEGKLEELYDEGFLNHIVTNPQQYGETCRDLASYLTAALAEIKRLKGCKFSDRDYTAIKSRAEKAETEITQLRQSLQAARHDALEEAAKACDEFVEAYSCFEPYPKGYTYAPIESKAAIVFAHGRFKIAADKIRALKSVQSTEGK